MPTGHIQTTSVIQTSLELMRTPPEIDEDERRIVQKSGHRITETHSGYPALCLRASVARIDPEALKNSGASEV